MIQSVLSCASALALVSGAAFAQSDAIPSVTMPEESSQTDATQDATTPDTSAHDTMAAPSQTDTSTQYTTNTSGSAMTAVEVKTRTDATKLAEAQFLLADINVDGTVDKAEFTAFATAQSASVEAEAASSADAAVTTPEQAFTAIAKSDSKISEDELVEARTNSFDAADTNRDKTLDASEQQKFAAMTTVEASADVEADVEVKSEQ